MRDDAARGQPVGATCAGTAGRACVRRRWPLRSYRRCGVGALALTVTAAIHGLAWLALERRPLSALDVAVPDAPWSERRALIVTLVPLSASVPSPSPSARSLPPTQRAPAHRASMGDAHAAAREHGRSTSSRSSPAVSVEPEKTRESRTDGQASAEAGDAPRTPARTSGAAGAVVDWRADLDSLRAARSIRHGPAAAIGAMGATGASQGIASPRKETAASTLERNLSKASRADCRRAYAGMGLLAIPALAVDAVTDAGCKW
ncbi:hypothetical protein [Burkholderia thailandensis]|uniref:hypothetical protein n=1 Tax=Burkholderia thailandensis TaxID=57975 RepID=UPI0004929C75|nr:hypothetical protein [Burkholderia thailandensis]AIP61656.1 hypothetical protein DR62_2950 [Burkholderia thailandensis]AOI51851.1 hypothetical protein WI24_08565 [Burkholderia thailandensis]MDD1482103.1 hypothetical protein [Burkholderia thailandensis]MDD1488530.1 hypothetical protein [Burkholderia thailandensis]MDD1492387.1 hypothetical protein [Burkholderia thailandensis]